ncbi:MAG: hypothetical protein EAZ37_06320 [Burkholderiales bacterium]|nr:MAG: hypothetical protein EAZ37_06320 [Burkholderiales bacterium]
MQLPLSALASYAAVLPHSHDHSHSHSAATPSHISHTPADADQEHSSIASDCAAAHHHCGASHLSLMVQTLPSVFIHSERQSFDLRAEAFSPTQLIPSIERPKWASV